MADRQYRIKENRWQNACMEGFEILPEGGVKTVPALWHTAFLKPLDSGTADGSWGRLSLKASHDGDSAFYIYALAREEDDLNQIFDGKKLPLFLADPETDRAKKLRILKELGAVRGVNQSDILLYSQRGRYLFLALDVVGEGDFSLPSMKVFAQGDNFMQTFPEVYREQNSFFHRWMSVYSSIFNDFQEEINELPKLLDVDTCPAELLPEYASWLGIDISGDFLPEDVCRTLVKEGYQLCKYKGTRKALERIIQIVLGVEADVLEHNTMRGYLLNDGAQIPAKLKAGGVLDVTILVHGRIEETMRHWLMFLLDQFKPVRARLHLIQLEQNATMDGNAYLDMNATIPEGQTPVLDNDSAMGSALTLT
ncbi:MAG: hypothetical protein IK115_03600 [Lachnospiraceae bacterium]|nr:hypothetical protein [Lachnospiraceae bacterium]